MGLGGFLGNGGNIAPTATSTFGGNSNGLSGFQITQWGFRGLLPQLFPNGGITTGFDESEWEPVQSSITNDDEHEHAAEPGDRDNRLLEG